MINKFTTITLLLSGALALFNCQEYSDADYLALEAQNELLIEQTDSTIAGLNATLENVYGYADKLRGQIDELNADILAKTLEIASLNDAIALLTAENADLTAEVAVLTARISELTEEVVALTTLSNELAEEVAAKDSEIESLTIELDSSNSLNVSLTLEIEELESDLMASYMSTASAMRTANDYAAELDATELSLGQAIAKIEEQKTKLKNRRARIQSLKAEVARLNSQASSDNSTIIALNDEIDTLEAQIVLMQGLYNAILDGFSDKPWAKGILEAIIWDYYSNLGS